MTLLCSTSVSNCFRGGPIQRRHRGDDWPAAGKVLEAVLEVCQPLLPPGETKNEERSYRGCYHEAASGGDQEFSLAVYGGGELCHLQPPRLRLLHFPSVGKHGGVVSGHVLHVHGAPLRHLQAVRAAWEVLQCMLQRRRGIIFQSSSYEMSSDKCTFTFSPETETGLCHHPGDGASFSGQRGGPAVHGEVTSSYHILSNIDILLM